MHNRWIKKKNLFLLDLDAWVCTTYTMNSVSRMKSAALQFRRICTVMTAKTVSLTYVFSSNCNPEIALHHWWYRSTTRHQKLSPSWPLVVIKKFKNVLWWFQCCFEMFDLTDLMITILITAGQSGHLQNSQKAHGCEIQNDDAYICFTYHI